MATKNKILRSGVSARKSLITGANIMADAVKSTLGPFGLNAALEKNGEITNDGVTIAREIASGAIADEIEARGARMMLEASTKTDDIAGDGTTTAMILAQAITKEAVKYLSDEKTIVAKKTPAEVIRIIEKERKEVTDLLIASAVKIETEQQLIESALVSVGNEELANLIGKTQFELGPQGFILAEETADRTSSIKRTYGIRTDNGFTTSLLVNNPETQSLEVKNTRVLLTNYTIQDLGPLLELGKSLAKTGVRSLVIVARAFGENAIRDCIANIEKGFAIFPINAPFTDSNEIMKDLAATLGAKFIATDKDTLDSIQLSDIGFAENVSARRGDVIFTSRDDELTKIRVEKRTEDLKKALTASVSDFEKKGIETRIAQLTNGFAILKVGATSELQRKYLKRKADDAVNAVRAAFQEGTVEGAGIAFQKIANGLPDTYILKQPLMSIYQQIESSVPTDFVIEPWVRDPVKVLRVALEQACSIASTFATSGIAIATEKDKPLDILLRKNNTPPSDE